MPSAVLCHGVNPQLRGAELNLYFTQHCFIRCLLPECSRHWRRASRKQNPNSSLFACKLSCIVRKRLIKNIANDLVSQFASATGKQDELKMKEDYKRRFYEKNIIWAETERVSCVDVCARVLYAQGRLCFTHDGIAKKVRGRRGDIIRELRDGHL